MFGGEPHDFLPHRFCRLVDGIARHHRTAAREGAGAPVELIGVAGHDIDVAHLDAELIGDDLGETGEMRPCPWVPIPVATLTLPFACPT